MHHLIVVDEDLAASRRRLRVAVMLSLTEKTSWKVEDTGYSVILKNKKVKSGGVKFGKWACVGLYVSRLAMSLCFTAQQKARYLLARPPCCAT